jgi:hypothetical protein
MLPSRSVPPVDSEPPPESVRRPVLASGGTF